ncbi:ATP-binding cassette domain-containing protein [Staphylococcus caeli]|uniref:ATP-binding cassette domain-containing protein n=1 Tax=Staphylococcus caeli TaxID=2201815 RepID=UPI003F5534EA
MIQLKNLNYRIKQQYILKNINLNIESNEVIGIVGESGSGKTTLMQIILGLIHPTDGTYTSDKYRILPIFQHAYDSFNPKFKMKQSIAEAIKYQQQVDESQIYKRLSMLMEHMQLDEQMLNKYPEALSGGQLQRFNTIRTMMLEPDIIIGDEMTASLDVIAEQRMIHVLREYYTKTADSHKGLILISHDIAFLNQIVERMIVMKNGEIVDDFHIQDLFAQQRHAYTKALLSIY